MNFGNGNFFATGDTIRLKGKIFLLGVGERSEAGPVRNGVKEGPGLNNSTRRYNRYACRLAAVKASRVRARTPRTIKKPCPNTEANTLDA